jgi:hypothetical protein
MPSDVLAMPRSPAELVALSRDLHARGEDRRVVLRTCYGVDLPEEVFVIVDEDIEIPGQVSHLFWFVAMPEFLVADCEPIVDLDERVYAIDRELVPLLAHDHQVYCYRLDELAAGRSTIFTLWEQRMDEYSDAERAGDSLLAVLHAIAARERDGAEAEYASPANRGAGSIDRGEVDWRHEVFARIERMQREVDARSRR